MHKVTLIDFRKSLRERFEARKRVGPYHFTRYDPATDKAEIAAFTGAGWFCYLGSSMLNRLYMDVAGSAFDMRVTEANDHLRHSRLSHVNGYWADSHCDSLVIPYVVALPHARGFLAAYGEGPGMWFAINARLHSDAREAAQAAHDAAERAAEREREREYRETELAELETDDIEEAE